MLLSVIDVKEPLTQIVPFNDVVLREKPNPTQFLHRKQTRRRDYTNTNSSVNGEKEKKLLFYYIGKGGHLSLVEFSFTRSTAQLETFEFKTVSRTVCYS